MLSHTAGCPPGSANTSTRGGIARAARLRAGSSALPAASRWAVGLSRAPPRVRGRKREYRRAGPGRLRPLWSPRRAPRLRLLESQGPDIRDLEPPQATHPKAVAPTPPQPPPAMPQTPSWSLPADHRSCSPPGTSQRPPPTRLCAPSLTLHLSQCSSPAGLHLASLVPIAISALFIRPPLP